ncbi:MAG TPA: ABC transporter substrate-binding protein [Candidatus Dormibacteraeota bacterium]|jgi:iron complex transport system substrate-binding protein
MRVVSLVPGTTEALFALGLGAQVAGVTHECDHPPAARGLPRVTRSNLDLEGLDGGGIDASVGSALAEGRPLYSVDLEAIRVLEPDLVVAQDVCDVCAVSADDVRLPGIRVLRQHPHSLEDVLRDMAELASACGVDGGPLLAGLRRRIAAASAAGPRVRGVFLEWLDPPFPAGHWTADLLRLAGIEDPLATAGRPSAPVTWDAVREAAPEILLVAPCGLDEVSARREVERMGERIAGCGARRIAVFDGSAYFNRPGPRLVDSLELLVREVAREAR